MKSTSNFLNRHFVLIACLGGPIVGIALALTQGIAIDWDTRNYHLYNGYAFLHDRLQVDLAPAQSQTYFNPLLDIPLYFIYARSGALTVSLAYAAFHGLQFTLLALIARRMLHDEAGLRADILALGLALTGCLGVIFLYEVGGFSHDIIVSIAFLAALLAVIAAHDEAAPAERPFRLGWLLFAGLLVGLGTGAKYTGALYAVALNIALITVPCAILHRLAAGLWFGLGVVAGVAISAGFWLVTMAVEFGNPVFPMLGSLFPSDLMQMSGSQSWRGFHSLAEYLFAPIVMTVEPLKVAHFFWRDLRFAFAYMALLVLALWAAARLLGQERPMLVALSSLRARNRYSRAALLVHMLVVPYAIGYLLWLFGAPGMRYLSGFEAIIPLVLVATLWLFGATRSGATAAVILLLFLSIPIVGSKGGRGPLSGDIFAFREMNFERYGDRLVLLTGFEGLSFVAPFFPASTRFIRLQTTVNWTTRSDQTGYAGMRERARELIAAHDGPIHVLYDAVGDEFSGPEPANTDADLARFGLRRRAETCKFIEGDGELRRITFCEVARLTTP